MIFSECACFKSISKLGSLVEVPTEAPSSEVQRDCRYRRSPDQKVVNNELLPSIEHQIWRREGVNTEKTNVAGILSPYNSSNLKFLGHVIP